MENMKVQLKEMLENWRKPHWPKIILFVSSSLAGFTLILIILEYTRRIGSKYFKNFQSALNFHLNELRSLKLPKVKLHLRVLNWTIWRRKDRMANNLIQQKQESYLIGRVHQRTVRYCSGFSVRTPEQRTRTVRIFVDPVNRSWSNSSQCSTNTSNTRFCWSWTLTPMDCNQLDCNQLDCKQLDCNQWFQ